jgi:hypothetical protein
MADKIISTSKLATEKHQQVTEKTKQKLTLLLTIMNSGPGCHPERKPTLSWNSSAEGGSPD